MNKEQFLKALKKGLRPLSLSERKERISFYSEIIDDKVEDGISQEEAVSELGSVDCIVARILEDAPTKRKVASPLKIWGIILLILGAPLWLPLLISLFAVALSLYVSMWAIVISLWSVFISVIISVLACVFLGVIFCFKSNALVGMVMIGISFLCIGFSIFAFLICKKTTQGILFLSKCIFCKGGKR